QQLDWPRHKVWCKVHCSRAQSQAGGSEGNSVASSSSTAFPATVAAAPVEVKTSEMDSIRRNENVHVLGDESTTKGGKMMTPSSSGSSQTSGHSSGTDCSLNSLTGSSSATLAAASSNAAISSSDPLAALLSGQPELLVLLNKQSTSHLPRLPPPLDPSALLAAANSNALFSSLALMTNQMQLQHQQQQEQQRQQDAAAAAAAAVSSLPAPHLFPPMLGSLSSLGLTNVSMPPPPSSFPSVSAFDPANTAALIAALTQQAASQQQQPPRFDLGASDPTPLMSSLLSGRSSSIPTTSSFVPPRPSMVSHPTFTVPKPPIQPSQSRGLSFSSAFSSTSSLHSIVSSASSTPSNPFSFDSQPSSMQKIIDPKPSMTVPPLRPKAVARRSGKPAAVASGVAAAAAAAAPCAAAAVEDQHRLQASSCASTSSTSAGSGSVPAAPASRAGSLVQSPDRFERPEGSRKRMTPSPQDDKKWIHVDKKYFNFLMTSPLDYDAIKEKLKSGAGKAVKEVKRPVVEDDDDCQIIGEVIKRRYRDHTENVIYNVTYNEHMAEIRDKHLMMSRHQATVLRLRYIAEHVIRSLNEFGWAVVDHFLGDDHVGHCAKEMVKLYEKGLFTAGQLMDNSDDEEFAPHHHPRNENDIKSVRSDYIYWYDGVDKRATEAVTTRLLVSMLDAMIMHFGNRIEGKEIGGRSRAMLAIYPGDETRYVKHVDNPNEDGRLITCIYYCNANWNLKEHGGALRLFPETSECAMDVDPQADRLVFFWSDRRNPHEVMPVLRHRFAVTIWYMDRQERKAELERKARRRAAARDAAAAASKPMAMEHDGATTRMLVRQQPAQLGAVLQFGSARQTHASTPHMGDAAAAASVSATALGLPPQAAAVGRAASPRSRSDNNVARVFAVARSECTQDEVSDDEEMSDFIPPNNGAQPDYEI
ncbi:hypothetical protein PMAYCL1PPCAC_30122, partial [Pristionchus mayeri]